jgi:hypothetical protein
MSNTKLYASKVILQFNIINWPITFGFLTLAQGSHELVYICTVTSSNPGANFLNGILLFASGTYRHEKATDNKPIHHKLDVER